MLANSTLPRVHCALKRANHTRLSVNNEIIKYVKVSVTTQYNIIRVVKPYRDRADGRAQLDGRIRIGIATGREASAQAQRSTGSLPYWELELVPGRRQNGSGWSLLTGG